MAEASESAAQRRFWLLERLLEKMDAEEALDLAARMEAFVTADGQAMPRKDDHLPPVAVSAPPQVSTAQVGNTAYKLNHSSFAAEPRPPATSRRESTGRLLNEGELKAFMNRAVQGATNRDLARVFGLTPRQANGIRMTLAKRNPQVALRSGLDA